jgi:hypothetical protein
MSFLGTDPVGGVMIVPDEAVVVFTPQAAAWLHALAYPAITALWDFRRAAREAYPNAANAMATMWDAGDAPADVAKMPRDFVVSLDTGAV